jgi:hypothetical protein
MVLSITQKLKQVVKVFFCACQLEKWEIDVYLARQGPNQFFALP